MKNIYKAKKFDIHEKYTGNMTENAHDIAIITVSLIKKKKNKFISIDWIDRVI